MWRALFLQVIQAVFRFERVAVQNTILRTGWKFLGSSKIRRASFGFCDVIHSTVTMIPRFSVFIATLVSFASLATLGSAAWPHDGSDIPPDSKAVFGSLENGVRYLIIPNDEPPGRASLRLYMDVGSLMEADDQQGMAHYLEHMAFNGSTQ